MGEKVLRDTEFAGVSVDHVLDDMSNTSNQEKEPHHNLRMNAVEVRREMWRQEHAGEPNLQCSLVDNMFDFNGGARREDLHASPSAAAELPVLPSSLDSAGPGERHTSSESWTACLGPRNGQEAATGRYIRLRTPATASRALGVSLCPWHTWRATRLCRLMASGEKAVDSGRFSCSRLSDRGRRIDVRG